MRLVGFGISLFLVFLSSLMAVNWLDAYSTQYIACSEKIWALAKDAKRFEYLKPRVLDTLDNMGQIDIKGAPCPSLRDAHKDRIQTYMATK